MKDLRAVDKPTMVCICSNANRIRLLFGMSWREFDEALGYSVNCKSYVSPVIVRYAKGRDHTSICGRIFSLGVKIAWLTKGYPAYHEFFVKEFTRLLTTIDPDKCRKKRVGTVYPYNPVFEAFKKTAKKKKMG